MASKKTRKDLKDKYISNPAWFNMSGVGLVGVGGNAKAGNKTITEVKNYDDLYKYCQVHDLKFFKENTIDAEVERVKKEYQKQVGILNSAKKKEIKACGEDDSKKAEVGEKYKILFKELSDKLELELNSI